MPFTSIFTGVLPIVLPHIIGAVEKAIGKGNGAKKKKAALDIVKTIAEGMTDTKKLREVPADADLDQFIELTVQQMNNSGLLQGENTILNGTPDIINGMSKMFEGAQQILRAIQDSKNG